MEQTQTQENSYSPATSMF